MKKLQSAAMTFPVDPCPAMLCLRRDEYRTGPCSTHLWAPKTGITCYSVLVAL
jgi:hypothetical protein